MYLDSALSSSPSFGEVCPVSHHAPRQGPLLLRVGHRGPRPQRIAEYIGDLITVHHARPGGPRRVLSSVAEMIEEDPEI